MKTKDYTVKLIFDRDKDKIMTIEAADMGELAKVVFGMDCGNGTPKSFQILGKSEEHEPTEDWKDWH